MAEAGPEYCLDDTGSQPYSAGENEIVRRIGELAVTDRDALTKVLRRAFPV
jgi:hypothetical protein